MSASRPESVILGRDPEVLRNLLNFYACERAIVLDCTANTRKMWKGVVWGGEVVYSDIDPAVQPDVVTDFRSMPFDDATFDVIVFDPPHLPAAAASQKSDEGMVKRYGLAHSAKADNISALFDPFLREAARVLRPDGLVFAKIKDFVHNHKYQWSLVDFVAAVRAVDGLTACDMTIKRDPSGGSLTSSKWENAHHARNCHCYWIVVRKGRCEARKCLSSNRISMVPSMAEENEHAKRRATGATHQRTTKGPLRTRTCG